MPSGQLGTVLRHLRRLVGGRPHADLQDAELLDQFVARRDMAAFEAIVQRYGRVVLGVCRRVLADEHDAEDAFQATFLVFARRAPLIRNQASVGSWLCGTAYRIASKARTSAVRRHVHERAAAAQVRKETEVDTAWGEMQPILDEELQRLPEKYRVPLVLCYLEGKSNEAAARELGWKPGSMSYRLAQARECLRERLVVRGVAISSGLLGPVLTANATVDVPAALAGATAQGAVLFAAGQAAVSCVSIHAVTLAEGVLRAMEFFRALVATFFVLMLAVLGGAGLYLYGGRNDTFLADKDKPGDIKPLDNDHRIAIQFSEDTQRFGIALTKLRDPRFPEKYKQLTSHERGLMNNTCIRIDSFDFVFGRENPGFKYARDKNNKLIKEQKTGDRQWTSTMTVETMKISVSQIVEIVVGEQTQLYDTLLVKYVVENKDVKEHTVGLRFMLDSYIGANDGVPFLVPPGEAASSGQLIDSLATFEKTKVPDFLRALESSDLNDKNATVAELGLKLAGLEPIQKVVICRWPQDQGASEARWEWKYDAINKDPRNLDSCVVMYWDKLALKAGESKTMGFTYGLGRIADGSEKVPMRLLAGGAAKVGRTFALTTYVKGARNGEKVRLQLPEGLELAAGQKAEQEMKVEAGKEYAQVSWRVQAKKAGKFRVLASYGERSTAQEVHVREHSLFD